MPGEISPYLVATPLVTRMFAFYGRVMPFGVLGYVGGALAGFVWSLVAGVVSSWLSQNATTAALSADVYCSRVSLSPGRWWGAVKRIARGRGRRAHSLSPHRLR